LGDAKHLAVHPFYISHKLHDTGMLHAATTYQQRATVRGMTQEELHGAVKHWLLLNSCTIRESTPPSSIKAFFPAINTMLRLGPRDENPKNIEVSIGSFGSSAALNISFTQEITRLGEAGFLYWGDRLEQLYRELGVPLDPYTLTQLYPPEWVHKAVRGTIRIYAVFMLLSLALIYAGLGVDSDLVAGFAFLVLVPGSLMAGLDIYEHRKLLRKTGNK